MNLNFGWTIYYLNCPSANDINKVHGLVMKNLKYGKERCPLSPLLCQSHRKTNGSHTVWLIYCVLLEKKLKSLNSTIYLVCYFTMEIFARSDCQKPTALDISQSAAAGVDVCQQYLNGFREAAWFSPARFLKHWAKTRWNNLAVFHKKIVSRCAVLLEGRVAVCGFWQAF